MTGSSPAPVKFAFDTVFEADGAMVIPARPKRSFTPEEVEAVREQAYREGERSAVALAEGRQAQALAEIAQAARAALSVLTDVVHQHRAGSAELARVAAERIADAALARFPEAPIEAALAALSAEIEAKPRLIVRARSVDDRMRSALEHAGAAAGFAGSIVLREEPGFPEAAFVLEWGDGKAAFDPADAARRVQTALDAALAAEGLHAEPLPIDPEAL